MQYRRTNHAGGTYFFTLVTHHRKPIFNDANAVKLLREAIHHVKTRHPFSIEAFVVLPDHLHCIWTLPENDNNYSMRWMLIKSFFLVVTVTLEVLAQVV